MERTAKKKEGNNMKLSFCSECGFEFIKIDKNTLCPMCKTRKEIIKEKEKNE